MTRSTYGHSQVDRSVLCFLLDVNKKNLQTFLNTRLNGTDQQTKVALVVALAALVLALVLGLASAASSDNTAAAKLATAAKVFFAVAVLGAIGAFGIQVKLGESTVALPAI